MPNAPEVPEISVDDAKAKLDDGKTVFVDIRDPDTYRAGRIEEALNLSNETIQEFLASTTKDQPIVVYCYHGNSSKGAAQFLMSQGFSDVQSMSGGFEAWRMAYDYEEGDDW